MRCFRKRMALPVLGFLAICFVVFNLIDDHALLPEVEQMQLQASLKPHEASRSCVPALKDVANYSATMNVTYRYLVGTPPQHQKYLTIGLSSVKRKKGSYLMDTLTSIFEQSSDQELQEAVVIVHLADFDVPWCENQAQEISSKFAHQVAASRLLVVHTPEEYYPPLDGLKRNYNDPEDRVRYRSKQNVDYAYLLNFCANLSRYYIMLEDDVRCSRNFLTALKKAITSREGSYWVMLEFSKLGYIGKLYHSGDLPRLAHFLLMFYQEMPCDWLMTHFRDLLVQRDVIQFKPSLFQHMGSYTSFSGMQNRLKDSDFVEDPGNVPDNPPARLHTNIDIFQKYDAAKAYSNAAGDYFWGKSPCTGDFFTVVFNAPTKVRRIEVVTGIKERPSDVLQHGALEVGHRVVQTKQGRLCSSFVTLAEFKGGKVDVVDVHHKVAFDVECVRLVVTACQKEWLIINTISLWTT